MQPWQVFHAAKKHIGIDAVARIFNKEKRSAYNWASDPSCTEVRCKSPLELLHTLFERMDTAGCGYMARAAIRYLETALDDTEPPMVREPLPTVQDELLADYAALAEFQLAIHSGLDMEQVQALKAEAIEEIERTVARYARGRG